MDEEEYGVVEMMEKYGGGFVYSLANCFRHADHNNREILKSSFATYWEDYKKMKKKEIV